MQELNNFLMGSRVVVLGHNAVLGLTNVCHCCCSPIISILDILVVKAALAIAVILKSATESCHDCDVRLHGDHFLLKGYLLHLCMEPGQHDITGKRYCVKQLPRNFSAAASFSSVTC